MADPGFWNGGPNFLPPLSLPSPRGGGPPLEKFCILHCRRWVLAHFCLCKTDYLSRASWLITNDTHGVSMAYETYFWKTISKRCQQTKQTEKHSLFFIKLSSLYCWCNSRSVHLQLQSTILSYVALSQTNQHYGSLLFPCQYHGEYMLGPTQWSAPHP